MARWLHHIGVGLLVAGMLGMSAPSVATACACGGIVSPDLDARIADEEALVARDGARETIVMRLNLQSDSDNAALIMPTPTPATVTSASPAMFTELATLSAPRVEERRNYRFGSGLLEGAASRSAPPRVVSQVQLGPLEATTLTGGDVSGVQEWLASHGYTMRPEVVAQLNPYLRQGWSFVAMRLTSTDPLDGDLAPVKLEFASDKFVYPMRMSAAATTPQRVVIYTLSTHRMQRGDADADKQQVDVDYAGSIAGRTQDPSLSEIASRGAFLTKTVVRISDPSAITSDFDFVPAPNDDPFQQVVIRNKNVDVTPVVFLAGILFTGMVVVAVGVVLLVVLLRRRRTPASPPWPAPPPAPASPPAPAPK
jgi:hypothetical protein